MSCSTATCRDAFASEPRTTVSAWARGALAAASSPAWSQAFDGTVKIEAFAREPGYRTKIAVTSTDPKVDPVGACVGARGARVKTIVRELGGEKIDIIKFFADPREMVIEALKPAVPREIIIDDKAHRVVLKVATDDLAIAIGRKGQNARLTSRKRSETPVRSVRGVVCSAQGRSGR